MGKSTQETAIKTQTVAAVDFCNCFYHCVSGQCTCCLCWTAGRIYGPGEVAHSLTAGTSGMAWMPAESFCCQMEAMYKVCRTTGLRVTPACGVGQWATAKSEVFSVKQPLSVLFFLYLFAVLLFHVYSTVTLFTIPFHFSASHHMSRW